MGSLTVYRAASDPINVYGGAGGNVAAIEDMETLEATIRLAADDVQQACGSIALALGQARGNLLLWLPPQKPWEVVEDLRNGWYTVNMHSIVTTLADTVRQARDQYEQAEADAIEALEGLDKSRFAVNGALKVLFLLNPFLAAGLNIDVLQFSALVNWISHGFHGESFNMGEYVRANHENIVMALGPMALLADQANGLSTEAVAEGLANLNNIAKYGDGLNTAVTAGTAACIRPVTNAEGLVRDLGVVAAPSGGESHIAITKLTDADGQVRWLVEIPGTRVTDFIPGENPADMHTNVQAITGDSNGIAVATVQAMVDAGIAPDEPVMLAGHSQGGIVAAGLAADPSFTEAFDVSAVLTAGSPVSLLTPAKTVQVLSLEHEEDFMPALSGGRNQAGRNQTTVTRKLTDASDPAVRDTINDDLPGHAVSAYADTAAIVDANTDNASLQEWKKAAEPFFDQDATAEQTIYTAERLPAVDPVEQESERLQQKQMPKLSPGIE
ncbi:MAG: hypothetical protein LBR27_11590 [Bifidobacteriaceae bacterium]|jgi:pimeloyl-ACP methyl ester carboxylesterase|nr:hypothetical protein [Bifidobacteriaceae bacterium]